jgi:predicted metal-dependent HD superfamily phosphohydrolase
MTDVGRWLEAWRALGVGDSAELRRLHGDVLGRYSEPHRHYHTSRHLAECLEKVEEIIALAEHPAEVAVGLWFHDAIYDPRRHDNEERSADWARDAARALGVGADSAERIHALVMVTRHAAPPIGIDAQVLVDADLSILGAPAARFQEYEAQVRQEYAWVPDATFRSARARILGELLGRPHLYSTARFRERYEARARDNLRRSLAALQRSEPTPSAGENLGPSGRRRR